MDLVSGYIRMEGVSNFLLGAQVNEMITSIYMELDIHVNNKQLQHYFPFCLIKSTTWEVINFCIIWDID